MIIQVEDGAALDVVQVGQGRDLVLLHSLLTDRTAFDAVVPLLMGRRRLTLVNLPGFGASDPAGPAIEDYADRLALLFPALGLDPQSTDLVAMSFGGFVGIALAARHGHLFNRLVLVDTAAAFPEPAKAPLRGMAERALGEGMGAVVWVYLFASVSYVLMRLGVVEYEAATGPQNLLFALTDSYSWHFLDLLPGVNITSAMGWKAPVDLQGGVRGALLVLFRVAVIYQILAKARQILRRDEPASPGARP